MGFLQDIMPALTPGLTKEIDARFRRVDDERAAEKARDSAEVRRHKQWLKDLARKREDA